MRASDGLANARVRDVDGGEHRLGELWQRRPVVLALIRHFA
jgi:hypothetical protein